MLDVVSSARLVRVGIRTGALHRPATKAKPK